MLLQLQNKLYGEGEENKTVSSLPPVLHIIRSATIQKIPYGLIERLNYYDLKAMVIENWIDQIQSALKNKENDRLASRGIKRRKATQDEINDLH